MPRTARQKSGTGTYHVILRGINRQTIFEDEEDAARFMQTLEQCQKKSGFTLYAYCLMGNHIHLLIKEEKEDLGLIMRRVGASYVHWYNQKYDRCGHLFQDRYRSEPVEDERYLLTVLRYIHRNPVKAKLVKHAADYPWSSYQEYLGNPQLIETDFILGIYDRDRERALEQFQSFHTVEENDSCLDMAEEKRWSDSEAVRLIKAVCQVSHCRQLQHLDRKKQGQYLKRLRAEGLSYRQISRITGLSRWTIYKATNQTE